MIIMGIIRQAPNPPRNGMKLQTYSKSQIDMQFSKYVGEIERLFLNTELTQK